MGTLEGEFSVGEDLVVVGVGAGDFEVFRADETIADEDRKRGGAGGINIGEEFVFRAVGIEPTGHGKTDERSSGSFDGGRIFEIGLSAKTRHGHARLSQEGWTEGQTCEAGGGEAGELAATERGVHN